MMRSDSKVEKIYLYSKTVDFRKPIDGLPALVELDIKVVVFDLVRYSADSSSSIISFAIGRIIRLREYL